MLKPNHWQNGNLWGSYATAHFEKNYLKPSRTLLNMTDLIACLSTGKGTLAHVQKVVEGKEWNKVFLIQSKDLTQCVQTSKNTEIIKIDTTNTISEMSVDIKKSLEGKINDLEVALNIVSGEGREHMAIISALLHLGLGIRLVALTKEGVKDI